LVVENGVGSIYVDGSLQCSASIGNTLSYPNLFTIGNDSNNGADNWGGGIDDVRLYNRALSSNEVATLYVFESAFQNLPNLQNAIALIGSNATFEVSSTGLGAFTYQWYYTNSNPLAVAGGYAQTFSSFVVGAVVTNGGFGYSAAPGVRFSGGGGSGVLGFTTVSNGSVTAISITNAGFGYSAPPAVVMDPPSGLIVGATNSTLTVSNVGPASLGSYWVVVSNSYGSVTSSVANITLLYPPSVAAPPLSQSLALRGTTTLSVTAAGTPPFTYQWTLAGTNLPAATNSTLVISNFSLGQVGSYAVAVSSPYGSVTSGSAQVWMLPSLTAPFKGSVDLWGQPVTLAVGAVGTGDLLYQWYFNGLFIPGATSNSFSLGAIQFTNAGLYSVVVSSALGSVTNLPYQVVVNPANVSLGTCPMIYITGTVGYVYAIQSTTDLSNTNSWVTVTNLTLGASSQIWADTATDTSKEANPRKFYRVTAGQ